MMKIELLQREPRTEEKGRFLPHEEVITCCGRATTGCGGRLGETCGTQEDAEKLDSRLNPSLLNPSLNRPLNRPLEGSI